MQGNAKIKDVIRMHSSKVEVFQWAFTSAIASLVYSEFIRNMRQKSIPVRHVDIPSIRYVQEMLSANGQMMRYLSDHFIDDMMSEVFYTKYMMAPELELFQMDLLDSWRTIFDLYIIPNVSKYLPDTIAKKFNLYDEKQQLFRENREIPLFNGKPIASDRYQYLVHQTWLQLLVLLPSIQKEIITPESNEHLHLTPSRIITIGNPNAICPIHLDCPSMVLSDSMALLTYVTNTAVTFVGDGEIAATVGEELVEYSLTTSPFNQTSITVLGDIIDLKEEKGT